MDEQKEKELKTAILQFVRLNFQFDTKEKMYDITDALFQLFVALKKSFPQL